MRIERHARDDPPRHRRRLPPAAAAHAAGPRRAARAARRAQGRARRSRSRAGGRVRAPRFSRSRRAPAPSCVPRWRSGFRDGDAAALAEACRHLIRSCRCRRAASGGKPRRCARPRRRPGSGGRWPRGRRSTTSSCATSPRSGRRRVADVAAWSRLAGLRGGWSSGCGRELRTFRGRARRSSSSISPTRRGPTATSRAPALPARVRQRAALARRPQPLPLAEGAADLSRRVDADPGDGAPRRLRRAAPGASSGIASSGDATLVVDHVVPLTKRAASSIAAEGRRFLRFVVADAAAHDVRLVRGVVEVGRRRLTRRTSRRPGSAARSGRPRTRHRGPAPFVTRSTDEVERRLPTRRGSARSCRSCPRRRACGTCPRSRRERSPCPATGSPRRRAPARSAPARSARAPWARVPWARARSGSGSVGSVSVGSGSVGPARSRRARSRGPLPCSSSRPRRAGSRR